MNDLLKVSKAVQNGLSVTCATCNKYWEARDKNIPNDKCAAKDGCRSPIGGGTFHEYDGPIVDFTQWCFVCGSAPCAQMYIAGINKFFGVCEVHLKGSEKLLPAHITDHTLLRRCYVKNGQHFKMNDHFKYGKTLAEKIEEAEQYLEDQGKKFNV